MPGYRCLLVCAMPGPYPATPNKGGRVLVQWMAKRQVVRFVRARVRSRSRSTNPDRHVGPARHTRKILATATGSPILMRTLEILTLACLLASLAGCAIAPADKSFSMPSLIGLGVADPSFRSPMAIAVIGGLITSTVLSLLVVPAETPPARA